ncbi:MULTISPECIES: DUF1573 domain-containing protein [Flavobacterium]|uniref:DUF1573 domain-containing protein n=2 Tax=Flavobacterium TaxID=237 RepID=A0A0A2LIL2_9FLAO|nr:MULTISPECIES: DUF1573 domain-containing protein [Flavobacterium]KGO79028.1 hypothetical protein Q763_15050 [Flavobacterium beibuense F44-8]MEE1899779.1 DUF1573 domain-containing protein [Flavobacterium rakeshii]MUV03477.1 DUF1573 domain-containing protein [Flavobacterium rakeshii]
MKKFLGLIAVLLIAITANAQSGAKIEFKEDTIDYGTVSKETDDGLRIFEFTNTGDAPLIIKDVKSTCGCTVPTKPKEPIMPGKTGKIEVKYNMHPGPIRKTITVQSNAVNYPDGVVALKIKGNVVKKEEVNILEKKKAIPNQ